MARKGGNPDLHRVRNSNTDAANRRRRELADDHIRTLLPVLAEIADDGIVSMKDRADRLNDRGCVTRMQKPWTERAVRRLWERLEEGAILKPPKRGRRPT